MQFLFCFWKGILDNMPNCKNCDLEDEISFAVLSTMISNEKQNNFLKNDTEQSIRSF